MRRALAALPLVVLMGACDTSDPVELPAATLGRELFADPGFSPSQFNAFSCATCHPTTRDAAPTIAVSLAGAVDRAAWWGGDITSLREAADFCWVYFMRGFPSLDPADDEARALFEYLASLGSGTPVPALPLTVAESIADPGRGDAGRGAAVWDRACRVCHGDPHTGEGRIADDVLTVPEASQAVAQELGADPRLVVSEKVRHGQFFGVGGNMPFFALELMSDAELADLLEYLDP